MTKAAQQPASIPIHQVQIMKLAVNPGDAGTIGITLPPDVATGADTVVDKDARPE
jgi:hypothetical protein